MNVDGRDILYFFRDFKLLILRRIIDNTIFPQSQIHIQGLLLSFPSVASSMHIDLFIPIENFPERLLLRDFEFVLRVT